jgi:hypothetical protein
MPVQSDCHQAVRLSRSHAPIAGFPAQASLSLAHFSRMNAKRVVTDIGIGRTFMPEIAHRSMPRDKGDIISKRPKLGPDSVDKVLMIA